MVSIAESSQSESSPPPEFKDVVSESSGLVRIRALSARQERKLVEYVEDAFLDIMRNYKKRNHPSSTLPTLSFYLRATRTILSLILQIPPIAQQANLRTALLLRFTSECLSAITHYPPPLHTSETDISQIADGCSRGADVLRELIDWLDELDRGWHAVLCAQLWDPSSREGIDIDLSVHPSQSLSSDSSSADTNSMTQAQVEYTPAMLSYSANAVTQTDRIRLRSLLLSTSEAIEEWLEDIQPHSPSINGTSAPTSETCVLATGTNGPDLESTLEHLGLQMAFDELFSRTLSAMGELSGEVLSAGDEVGLH